MRAGFPLLDLDVLWRQSVYMYSYIYADMPQHTGYSCVSHSVECTPHDSCSRGVGRLGSCASVLYWPVTLVCGVVIFGSIL